MDLEEPLIASNGHPMKRLLRRNSGTFSSLRKFRCFMLFLIVSLVLVGLMITYHCPNDFCFAQRPSYTIGKILNLLFIQEGVVHDKSTTMSLPT